MESNILIIVEGSKTEPNFFNRLSNVFGLKFDIYCLETNIYSLYKKMKEINFNGDIKDILSEIHPDKKEMLSKKFAYTYLIFDCDAHHSRKNESRTQEEIVLDNLAKLSEMAKYFVDETDPSIGKLYINYPTKKVHTCDKKPVRKEWIEDLAVKAALDILKNDEIKDYLTDRIYALQGEENPRIPKLKTQLADVEKRLTNIMQAIEQGIIFDTTKERFAALEKEKKELEITILQEKIKKPFLTKEQIRFGIEKFGKLDISTKEGKQRLIDGFINAIYVYDDKITFTFNYKDGTRTVMLSELSDGKNNSDLKCQGAPKKRLKTRFLTVFYCLLFYI